MKEQIIEKDGKMYKVLEILESSPKNTFEVEFNNEIWEIEKEAKRIILKDLIIPEGWQLMPFNLAVYLYDNDLIKIHPDWELTEQLSKKNLKLGYKYSALVRDWGGDHRLVVSGCADGGDRGGYAFGVRFCGKISKTKKRTLKVAK